MARRLPYLGQGGHSTLQVEVVFAFFANDELATLLAHVACIFLALLAFIIVVIVVIIVIGSGIHGNG